ncbi:MAG: hypothetical protein Q9227_007065 [Pyrenula ochraceoflavens]
MEKRISLTLSDSPPPKRERSESLDMGTVPASHEQSHCLMGIEPEEAEAKEKTDANFRLEDSNIAKPGLLSGVDIKSEESEETSSEESSQTSTEELEDPGDNSSEEDGSDEETGSDISGASEIEGWGCYDFEVPVCVSTKDMPGETPTGSNLLAERKKTLKPHKQQIDSLAARMPDPNESEDSRLEREDKIDECLFRLSTGRYTGPIVHVKVGPGKMDYQVPFHPLAEESVLARKLLQDAPTTANGQKFVENNAILLGNIQPELFDLFLNWLHHDLFLCHSVPNDRVPEESLMGLLVLSADLQASSLQNAVLEAMVQRYLRRGRTWSVNLVNRVYGCGKDPKSRLLKQHKLFVLDMAIGNPNARVTTSSVDELSPFWKEFFQRNAEYSNLLSLSDGKFLEHMKVHHWVREDGSTIASRDGFRADDSMQLLLPALDDGKHPQGKLAGVVGRRPSSKQQRTVQLEDCEYCLATGTGRRGNTTCGYCGGSGKTREQATKSVICSRRWKEQKENDQRKSIGLAVPRATALGETSVRTVKRSSTISENIDGSKRMKPMELYRERERIRIKQEREDELDMENINAEKFPGNPQTFCHDLSWWLMFFALEGSL